MTAAPARRWDADTVAAEIAARISDRATGTGDFTAAGLSTGASGAALLLSELSKGDPSLRTTVHALLAAGAGFAGAKGSGLITGLAGLGFATKHAARSPRDYAAVRSQVDATLRHRLGQVLDAEYDRMESGVPGADRGHFDVVSGVTGLGRYFLTGPSDPEAVHDVLRYLVALTEPVEAGAVKAGAGPLPGWFSPRGPPRWTRGGGSGCSTWASRTASPGRSRCCPCAGRADCASPATTRPSAVSLGG